MLKPFIESLFWRRLMIEGLVVCIFAYLMGSIPTGVIISRKFGNIDIQAEGSRNIGATNVARLIGKKFGVLTLVGDVIKGSIPVILAILVIGKGNLRADMWVSLAAVCSVVGHMYPIFLKFKGGKGIATSAGVFLVLAPLAVLIDMIIFLLVLVRWRFVSLGSLSAAFCMPILIALLPGHNTFIPLALVITILIFYRHHENIERLLRGEERRWQYP